MNIYLLNIAIIIISYLFWTQLYREERGKKIFCVQVAIQWILISGLRSMQVGADTDRYRIMFENTLNMKWSEIEVAILQVFRGNNLYKDPRRTFSSRQSVCRKTGAPNTVFPRPPGGHGRL